MAPELIVITGPTASGKTAVAVRLAEKHNGEIICADSRTVYKGLDIGTAKPTAEERQRVPHHLLDIVTPDEHYNLARFQHDARVAIADVRSRGKLPFLVGGTGLYIDSIVLDYQLGQAPDPQKREELEGMSLKDLFRYSNENNITLPADEKNPRHIVRIIEQGGINSDRKQQPGHRTHVVGIMTDNDVLKERIDQRAHVMFEAGLTDEACTIAKAYSWDVPPLKAPAYTAAHRYINNELTREGAIDALRRADWQLVRKQMTWLRRHPWATWLPLSGVEGYVDSLCAQKSDA